MGYRLIWVDNGSGLDSINKVYAEAASCSEMVPMWLPNNIGFVKGTNMALRLIYEVFDTDADFVVLLNNDVEVTAGWLDRFRRVFERDTKLHAVGPITGECASWQGYGNAGKVIPQFQIPAGFERLGTHERGAKLDYCYGELFARCNMVAFFCTAFRANVFQQLGYLDEDFGVGYGDDDDLCYRMREAKMDVGVSMGTYVYHHHMSTFKKLYSDEEIVAMRAERRQTYLEKHGEEPTL